MQEIASCTPLFAGVTYERLEGCGSLQWPVAADGQGQPLLYNKGFAFDDGKAKLHPLQWLGSSEGKDLLSTGGEKGVIDAGIISAAQKVEHYEIAAYGTVRTYAELLGKREISQLLQQTLEEEKDADSVLNDIAGSVNIEAQAA